MTEFKVRTRVKVDLRFWSQADSGYIIGKIVQVNRAPPFAYKIIFDKKMHNYKDWWIPEDMIIGLACKLNRNER